MSRPFPDLRVDPYGTWLRMVTARAMADARGSKNYALEAKRLFGEARGEVVIKAATDAASTTGWGSATVTTAVGAFIGSLRGSSAAAELIARGRQLDLSGIGGISLPTLSADYPPLSGVAEGGAIPVNRPTFGNVTLAPTKLAGISAFTNELREYSGGNAEAAIREAIETAASRGLDALVLSNAAATSTTPAGLLNGTAALTATTGGGVAAVASDIGKLVGAIHAAGGGTNIIIFASPPQAAAIGIYAPNLALPVIPAPTLAAGTIVAVEAAAFASGFTAVPEVSIARDATLQMDTAPAALIGTAGAPNTVAAPTRSMLQTDSWALRLILRMGYAMRLAGGAQWIASVTW